MSNRFLVPHRPELHVLPRTLAGRISMWLFAAFVISFVGTQILLMLGDEDESGTTLLRVLFVAAQFATALAAGTAAMIAMFRRREAPSS